MLPYENIGNGAEAGLKPASYESQVRCPTNSATTPCCDDDVDDANDSKEVSWPTVSMKDLALRQHPSMPSVCPAAHQLGLPRMALLGEWCNDSVQRSRKFLEDKNTSETGTEVTETLSTKKQSLHSPFTDVTNSTTYTVVLPPLTITKDIT